MLALASFALAMGVTAVTQAVWKDATAGYRFEFPRDHASHPEYQIEWWYYTGNVATASGRRFGYQITFFRVGVDPAPENPSRWAVRDLHMAHLAISDPEGRRYRFDERLGRGGPGLAGAAADRYRVWNDDWSAGLDDAGRHVLQARSGDLGLALTLEEGKRPAVNGVDGISQKGARPGNASHYYSLTRMPTRGTLTIGGEAFDVTGESWMDHEFGTSFLETGQRGWDWLSLQLDDGRELMLYQLRRADGTRDPRSSGTLVETDGRTRHLTAADFTLTPAGATATGASGAGYPIAWTVAVPSQALTLSVGTPLPDQELRTLGGGIAYWEGMVTVTGAAGGRAVSGRGYLEMTGYKGSLGRVMGLTAARPR
ncbi:MAG: lipocalin-like domain-containing protein [Vicinamibacterales bacterium]